MKLASRISSIRRIAWKACRSCSAHSDSMWVDSFASSALAGWIRSPSASSIAVETRCLLRRDERFGRRLEAPGDAVLDLLRGVRLGEDLREEELQEVEVVLQPVVAVVLRPALVRVKRLLERTQRLRTMRLRP